MRVITCGLLLCAASTVTPVIRAEPQRYAAVPPGTKQFHADYPAREAIDPRLYCAIDGVVILYFFAVYKWLHREREFERVSLTTQYDPPEDLSPGAMRYLRTGRNDRQTVAAVLLRLASRGLVSIQCADGLYLVTKRVEEAPADLPAEEFAAFTAMFPGGESATYGEVQNGSSQRVLPRETFLVHPIEGVNFDSLYMKIDGALRESWKWQFFVSNLWYCVPAVLVSLFFAVGIAMMPPQSLFTALVIVSSTVMFGIAHFFYGEIRDWIQPRVMRLLVLLVSYAACVGIFYFRASRYTDLYEFAVVLAFILNFAVPPLLRTPTYSGWILLGQVRGYREFLATAELEQLHRLPDTVWFTGDATKNLSYAVALDLHGAWGDYLANAKHHTGVLEARESNPLGRSEAIERVLSRYSDATIGPVYLRGIAIFAGVGMGFFWLLPYGFDTFRAFAALTSGGLLALYGAPSYRSR